ncbi:hypothetical protein [Dinghuibacter silviterrae]|uniref:Uncharacterized protein n=1 Tax=Dinghuibacter silviterrae TaxID=1539049 RepID=A0A4R8DI57_9BACT|nr:hypothetical protein [Dinghuibacter silviterrae]TDW97237.1 hypothetical protein EDB95_5083 [Dinghuibacter silviterrae]
MRTYICIGILLVLVGSCRKYPEASPLSGAAYIRVFNDIATSVDFLHSQQAPPFLTFIMDPHLDAGGAPDTGLVVGDFLGTRQLYSLSYPINEGNSLGVDLQQIDNYSNNVTITPGYVNYEYPGNAHVPTAPALNGFDLSSWAQVPSGKHRFVFVIRPQTDTAFSRLSTTIRHQILIDTTLDLQAGEVYTMEALSTDLDNNRYGAYVRQEQFIHQAFEPDQLYAGFVNLSGVTPHSARLGYFPDFPDSTVIYYTYYIHNDFNNGLGVEFGQDHYNPLTGYNNNYYTTLNQRMATQISYLGLPLLDKSYFFIQDSLRSYANYLNNSGYGYMGNFPFVQFSIYAQDSTAYAHNYLPFVLNCAANPVTFNNYLPGVGTTFHFTPNLDLLVNVGGQVSVYPTLNIMEMVYDRVYLMQIQNAFNQVPNQ